MHNDFWKARLGTERKYFKAINQFSLILKKALKTKESLEDIFNFLDIFAASPVWQEYSEREALKMVETVSVQNAASWREAASKSRRGNDIHVALRKEFDNNKDFHKILNANASLIKSLPYKVSERITEIASNAAISGKRSEEVLRDIKKLAPQISESKARTIARTEVSKAQSGITENRANRLGLNWYIWRGALDERERKSHRHLEGVAIRFSEPPNPEALIGIKSNLGPYHAGCGINCRCFEAVIVDPSFPKFPLQCYMGGRIIALSQAEFLKVF